MDSNIPRWLVLVLGILLIVMGIVLFFTPVANSIFFAYFMSALMLIFGGGEIIYYLCRHDKGISGWILADGIITVILGALLLFIPGATIPGMTILFAMWVLFTGVIRLSAAFAAKDRGSSDWGWILAAGILGILIGIWFMFDPLLTFISIGYILPLAFIVQGVSAIGVFLSTDKGSKEPA